MPVTVVIITRNRSGALAACLDSVMAQQGGKDIIVVDNASSDDTRAMVAARFPQAILLPQSENLGIPGGRNAGIRHATGDIVVCIDDDAQFTDPGSLERCAAYFNDVNLACLAFRIVDQKGQVVKKLIPRRDRKIISEDTPGAMFSGTGFVVRRAHFLQAGGFWDRLNPYFGEEPDLSYRLLDLGYSILHTPHITVRHDETPVERPSDRRLYCGTRNAPWIALRSLPWYAVISLTVLSWGYFFLEALRAGQLRAFTRGVCDSIKQMPAIYRIRKPISARTRTILRTCSGLFMY